MNTPHRHQLYRGPVGVGAVTPGCVPGQLTVLPAPKKKACCAACEAAGTSCGDKPQGVGAGDTNVSVTPATSPWVYFFGGVAAGFAGVYAYKNRRALVR